MTFPLSDADVAPPEECASDVPREHAESPA
jgi:hypothetical protein